jgi:zinc protease
MNRIRVGLAVAGSVALLAAAGAAGHAAAAESGAAAGGFRVAPPARTVLKNGLTVLVLERHGIPLIQLRLLIKSGAIADPPGKEGTASLTARLLKRGTRNRPAQQFSQEVEFVGGTLESSAAIESTVITGEFASRDVEVGLNLLADMVLNPTFSEEEFAREKRQLLADIVSGLDDPEQVADQAFDAWLYGAHPYGRPVAGTKRSVSALARGDVASFYAARYAANNALLAIVGDIGAAQAAQRVEKYFGGWKRASIAEVKLPEAVPVHGRKVLLVDKPDASQSQIRFGNLAIRRNDPDFLPLMIGNTVLGGGYTSWLVDEVRVKRGLTYYIRSLIQGRRAAGSFLVSTFSKNPTVLETIKVSLDQIRRLREDPLEAEVLDKARTYRAGQYPLMIESPEALAAEVLDVDFYGLDQDYVNQYQKRVRGVGLDAVKRTAGRYMPLNDLAIVVVGPAAELKEPLATLGPVTLRTVEGALGAS